MKFAAFLIALVTADEISKGSVVPHHPAAAPHHVKVPGMSAYQWGLYDVDTQLKMFRESEYKKNQLEAEISKHQVDDTIRREKIERLQKLITEAMEDENRIRDEDEPESHHAPPVAHHIAQPKH